MDRDQILSLMKAYFEKDLPPERLAQFATTPATELLEDSVDVMTFVLHLDDELHTEIKLDQVGPRLTAMTFQELAEELCRMVSEKR
jgi:acyl carrier protein